MSLRACVSFSLAVLVLGAACRQRSAVPPAGRSPDEHPFAPRVQALVPPLLEEYLVPGVAVALVRRGEVVWAQGFGLADVAASKPVTPDTVFNIGSISKTVAAWGAMRLSDQGRVALDAPVETYLTRWHLPSSDFDRSGVTLRRLLSHTAGLSLHGYPGWQNGEPLPTLEESLSGKTNGAGEVRQIFPPGTRWQYSGGGYTLAQLVVEEVSQRSFAEYMQTEVLRPLGMNTSEFVWSPEIASLAARPHDEAGRPIQGPRFVEMAAAGLQTSVLELGRFVAAGLSGPHDEPPGRGVLRPETVRLMQDAAPASDGKYGLGYGIQTYPHGRVVGHHGANEGWMAGVDAIPERGEGLVVLTNSSNGSGVIGEVECAWRAWAELEAAGKPCKKAISHSLRAVLLRQGVAAAVERYREIRRTQADTYELGEDQLNGLGYQLLQGKRVADAIEIFKLNVEMFPSSWNPHDSLAEAHALHGDLALAIASYERSLALNPRNQSAIDALKKLRAEQGTPTPSR